MQSTAQVTPKSAFSTIPKSIFGFISEDNRLDMIDYFESGIDKPIVNELGDTARIAALTDSSISVDYAPEATLTLAPISCSGSQIIMLINSLATPTVDSRIQFFTHDWKPIDTESIIAIPKLSDWFVKTDKATKAILDSQVEFLTVEAQYHSDPSTLILTPTIGDYIAPEIVETVTKYLIPQKTYVWTGKKFTLQK